MQFPLRNDTSRKIIHIDMDAFYASIEERDNPEYRGKPVVIAKHPKKTKGRGVVSTANYEARKYGIHSAMSAKEAYRRCPEAIFCEPRMEYYKQVSRQLHQIFHQYTDMIEPLAFDEAYLDVTQNKKGLTSAIKLARLLQKDIYQQLHLTCSAGVSYNKFLAKLASDYKKPSGLTWILPEEAVDFLSALPIEKFKGIGKKTVPRMHDLGVFTGADLLEISEMKLIQEFGKMGYELYRKARGIHNDPVKYQRERKSIGTERTYGRFLTEESELISALRGHAERIAKITHTSNKKGKTIVLKLRYSDFTTITRQKTLTEFISTADEIYHHAFDIWETQIDDFKDGIRLSGITLTNLESQEIYEISLPI